MARMSIDDMLARDTRVDRLAMLCGWSRRETRACLEDIWALCYDRVVPYLPAADIEVTALRDAISKPAHQAGFVDALIAVGLARPAVKSDRFYLKKDGARLPWKDDQWRERVYIAGSPERIGYLLVKAEAGFQGGVKSGESRRSKTKQTFAGVSSETQAPANPPAPDLPPSPVPSPSPVPDLLREDSDTPAAVGASHDSPGLFQLKARVDAATGDLGRQRARKLKPNEPTAAEVESVRAVLTKLGEHNGVRYTQNAEHTRLIVARLRDGVTEIELRAVVAYCAFELEWKSDPDMEKYLRPETLFGPKTIAKYLDPARTWAEKTYPDEFKQPDAALVEPPWMAGSAS